MNMKSVMENNKKCLEESTSTVDNLKGVINEINTTYMDWFYDLENIKKDLKESTSSVDDLKLVINEIDTRYKERFSDLSGKVADLEKQIKDLKSQTVAFNVIDAVSFTGTDPIKFSRVILNEGNAYNKDTGNFTAPVDGIYQFNAHICCKIDTDVEYEIKVERTVILTGEFRASEGSSDTKCTSFSAAALVRKGENVRVGGMPFSNLDRVGSNDLSSFSGTLIQKL